MRLTMQKSKHTQEGRRKGGLHRSDVSVCYVLVEQVRGGIRNMRSIHGVFRLGSFPSAHLHRGGISPGLIYVCIRVARPASKQNPGR